MNHNPPLTGEKPYDKYNIRIIIMNISSILRGLLDIVELNQIQSDEIEQANLEMLPIVKVEELPIGIAQKEFDSENPEECFRSDSFEELDVVKRNAGLPVNVISTDSIGF